MFMQQVSPQQQPAQGMFMQEVPLQQPLRQPSQGMFMQQPPPQQQPLQVMVMQGMEQLHVPDPPGLQEISTLGSTAAGVFCAEGPLQAVQDVRCRQQHSSTGSWQYMYAAGSQAVSGVLEDLQAIRLH
jgi:hypothetical protein